MAHSYMPRKAVILAGGKGTRLYPVTREFPKSLLPVGGRPAINHLVELFHSFGVRDIAVLTASRMHPEFVWWRKRYYPHSKITLTEEKRPLGTLGGLGLLKDWIADQPFFLVNGDNLQQVNLESMAAHHEKKGAGVTIGLACVPDPHGYGVAVCNKDSWVEYFLEKPKNPPTNYISSGLYILNPELVPFCAKPRFSMIEQDLFPKLAKEGRLSGFKFQGKWTDCGTWERYEAALKAWR